MGYENIKLIWVEQAERLSHLSARLLIPTFRRDEFDETEFFFTWNPTNRTDWVWQRFMTRRRESDVVATVNWRDNPWFPRGQNEERLNHQRDEPETYEHVWEGQPVGDGISRQVLPYRLLEKCVAACRTETWEDEPNRLAELEALLGSISPVPPEMGVDVADGGTAQNAVAIRRGPVPYHSVQFRNPTIGDTARDSHKEAERLDVERLFYDAGGMGAGLKSYYNDFREQPKGRNYAVRAGAVRR